MHSEVSSSPHYNETPRDLGLIGELQCKRWRLRGGWLVYQDEPWLSWLPDGMRCEMYECDLFRCFCIKTFWNVSAAQNV
jgi:hypothetical protein